MADAMTFTSLQEDMRRYLERGDATADPIVFGQIPRLINLAERRIAQELKIEGFIVPVTGTLQADVSIYPKPDRWRQTTSWSIGTGTAGENRVVLLTRSYEYLRTFWPDATQTGQPVLYADYDANHWLLAPTPDDTYPFEVLYYEQPELLSDAVQTNWVTENLPQLLLYASLLEASPFLKADDRIAVWQQMYDRAAATANGEDLGKILDRASVRDKA